MTMYGPNETWRSGPGRRQEPAAGAARDEAGGDTPEEGRPDAQAEKCRDGRT